MIPRRQSFLLSRDEKGEHFVTEVNKNQLPKGGGFSFEQCVLQDGKVFAFSDQFDAVKKIRFENEKNTVIFSGGKWIMKKLRY